MSGKMAGLDTFDVGYAAAKTEIDRLTRLCKAKDAEIKQLIESQHKSHDHANEEIRDLEAQIAMQAEALEEAAAVIKDYGIRPVTMNGLATFNKAISTTSETVAAWIAKETEPLHREVATLRDYVKESLPICGRCNKETVGVYYYHDEDGDEHCCEECHKAKRNFFAYGGEKDEFVLYGLELLNNTQATALSYEREVRNRGAVKALEEAIIRLHNDNSLLTNSDYEAELARMAEEYRAANKGEVK